MTTAPTTGDTIARILGIIGGGNIAQLGTAKELAAFFRVVDETCSDHIPYEKLRFVTEVLYRGNVKGDEFGPLKDAWASVLARLKSEPLSADLVSEFQSTVASVKLNWNATNAGEFFAAYKDALLNALEGAQFEIEDFGLDARIRLGPAEVPTYKSVEERPDVDFDVGSSTPIWLRQ